jgi:hypothetical protein
MYNINLDNRITVLFDILYNKLEKDCYKITKIDHNDIPKENVKVFLSDPHNKDILYDLIKDNYGFISVENNVVIFKRYSNSGTYPCSLHIKRYEPTEINDMDLSINLDSKITYLFSELLIRYKTKHILCGICNVDTKFKTINKLLENNKNTINIFNKDDILCLQFKEHFFKNITLEVFLQKNKCNIRALLFQVIHTLAVIHENYPSFQHNKLIPENILLYKKKISNIVDYYFDNKKYFLDDTQFDIKIYNFEHCSIQDLSKNKPSDKSDLETFIESLTDSCDDEANTFLEEINKTNANNYSKILEHSYFSKYKEEKEIIESDESSEYYLGRKNKTQSKSKNNTLIKLENKKISLIDTNNELTTLSDSDNSISNNITFSSEFKYTGTRKLNGGLFIPPVSFEKNTPFKSNERTTFEKRKAMETEKDFPKKDFPKKDFNKDSDEKNPSHPPIYLPKKTETIDKIQNVNISDNPTHQHTYLKKIYEDMLPRDNGFNFMSLSERNHAINFMRGNILDLNDGEEMSISSESEDSLLSYVKLIELNPHRIILNPYVNIPNRMILYSSAYPIRYDANKITIAKNSMGLNVRIYEMNLAELNSLGVTSTINKFSFDLWREIYMYEYIRENILKKKVSPNFIGIICYKLDTKSNIDFSKIRKIVDKNDINNRRDLQPELNIGKNNIKDNPKLTKNISYSLVAVTESPNHNIYKWASNMYEKNGAINTMVNSGYHADEVWMSVLFQIAFSMAVMYKHGILIKNFTMEDNVYIKDLFTVPTKISYWKYIIDDYEYYVPNYGYLVLIDSNYKTMDNSSMSIADSKLHHKHKIAMKSFQNNVPNLNSEDIEQEIYNNFKSVFDPNVFSNKFVQLGFRKPNDEIVGFMNMIHNDKTTNVVSYVNKYFKRYLHTRVGTPIRKIEKTYMPTYSNINSLKKGKLILYEKMNDYFVWAIYAERNEQESHNPITRNSTATIYVKEDLNSEQPIAKIVHLSSLRYYPDSLFVSHEYNPSVYPVIEKSIIETYTLE